ncbi:hypothetical protein L3Y34_009417 [Caenorhabditis briggsae]|uniref:Uncharacterized protein n=1 Tax=Caenorhabditis briggsae TaxID=6238 RepID=A0AAE9A8R2_CAEBR|nr:hypothetical protein L3Y34_009417 [Caenorhabditis briggsae]
MNMDTHNWRDVSVDPCQDFYEAACGKYNEHTISLGTRLFEKSKIVKNLVKEFLDKNEPSESKSEQVMKWFYGRCKEYNALNETQNLENMRMEQLKLIRKIGSWPMLDGKWKEEDFASRSVGGWSAGRWAVDWPSVGGRSAASRRSIGGGSAGRSVGGRSTFGRRLVDGQSTVGRQPVSVITRFGGTRLGFFNLILTNEILFIHDPSGITQSIEEVEEVLMDIVKLSGSHPDSKMIQKDIKDLMKLNEELAGIVIRNLPLASLRVFTRNHFNKFNLDMASQLVEDIKESLKQTIQESTWLQEETKKSALLKLKHMKKTIGYPKELEVPGALDVDMSNKDTYFAAILEINRFQTEQTFNNLASLLPMVPDVKLLDSNAFYHMDENHLKLNVAILDDPFLDITYPTYAKIASIGEVIGHEIGHGFDTDGRKRDEKGKKRDWWTPEDSKEYDRRAQCLIDQYNNYDDPDYGRNLNGSMTIDEMAADQIGVELSWKTYNRVDFSLEPSIFGFEDEKPDKLFFHLTALNWCGPRPKRPLSYQQEQVQKRLQKRSTVRLGRR